MVEEQPRLYVQSIEDEANENKDSFDKTFDNIIGGLNTEGYRVGVLLEEEYETSRVGNLDEAVDEIESLVREYSLDIEVPAFEELDKYIVEERYWQ